MVACAAAGVGMGGIAGRAAGCGCAPGVAAWHSLSARVISVAMRDSATALPDQRRPTLSGVSGCMVRRKHSMLP